MKKEKKIKQARPRTGMSRKEAIKKAGYGALTAAATMLLLSKADQANAQLPSSPAPPPPW